MTRDVDGSEVRVGGPALLEEAGRAELPDAAAWRAEGAIVLHVLVDGAVAGALALADEVREESRQAVDALHAMGIEVVMITGDAEPVADAVAAELGIDRVFAGVRPQDKAAKVAELQARRASWSRWSATASTTRPRWRRPMSASRSARAPTWPSPRRA